MKQKLTNLSITRVAFVPAGSNPEADIVLVKSAPPVVPPQSKEPGFMKKNINKSKLSAEDQATLATLLEKAEATDIPEAPAPPPPAEDYIKTLPPEAQAIIKSAQDRAEEAVKKAEAATAAAETATATANVEKAAREESEFVTANTNLVKAFPGTASDNAKLLFRVQKSLSKTDYEAISKLLASGSAALEASTKEVGGPGAEVMTSANDLNAKAEEIRKADPKMSFSQAYEKAMEDNPELVKKARKKPSRRADDDDE